MPYPYPATCPTCGREPVWFSDISKSSGRNFCVVCVCGLYGPEATTREAAAQAWNEQAVLLKQEQSDKDI